MNTKLIALIAWFAAATALAGGMAAHAAGYRVNLTASAPTGVWRLEPIDGHDIQRGDLVSVCPPRALVVEAMASAGYLEPGTCASGSAELLKPVVAVAGDTVEITTFGVRVNGTLLPNSKAVRRSIGSAELRSLPYGAYYVEAGDVWLVSSYSAESFDSRYFGPVDAATIEGIARPAFVRGDVSHVYGGPRS